MDDIQEWEIRFQVCLVEDGVESIVEGLISTIVMSGAAPLFFKEGTLA